MKKKCEKIPYKTLKKFQNRYFKNHKQAWAHAQNSNNKAFYLKKQLILLFLLYYLIIYLINYNYYNIYYNNIFSITLIGC